VLPPESELRAAYDAYFASLGWPGFHARLPQLAQLGAAHGADVELRLGHYLGVRDESDLMGSQAGVQARPYSV
jgi:hypothetical protein